MASSVAVWTLVTAVVMAADNERPRVRDLGIRPGVLEPGRLNAITDVEGVLVGHTTLITGESVRTGVTAVLPHDGNLFQHKVPAAVVQANAFGKAAGLLQVNELGNLETPIVLTNTLCVGTAVQAVVDWTLAQPGNGGVKSVNAVVGETNDGFLNDIRKCAVRPEHDVSAIDGARSGLVAEGAVGAGTGVALSKGVSDRVASSSASMSGEPVSRRSPCASSVERSFASCRNERNASSRAPLTTPVLGRPSRRAASASAIGRARASRNARLSIFSKSARTGRSAFWPTACRPTLAWGRA